MSLRGLVIEELGLPGLVSRVERRQLGGHWVGVRTSSRYTIIEVDGFELFFIRETGRFDGCGGMRQADDS